VADLNLKSFDKLYPMLIHKYESLVDDETAVIDKLNKIITYLNSVGKLTNDVVKNWNTVMNWVLNDGLLENVNDKLTDMINKGQLDSLINSVLAIKANQSDLNITNNNVALNASAIASNNAKIGDLTTSNTTDKSSVVNMIKEVKTQANTNATSIVNIGNGSPKGTYATVTALQTAFPTGTTGIYIVTADGGWYYWSGSAWTKGGTYQSTGIASGSITPDKTSFMSIGKNLFNPATSIVGQMVDYNSGNLASNTDHVASDYISVSPSTNYVINKSNFNLAFYDINKVFIGPAYTLHTGGAYFTTPSNCAFIRFSCSGYNADHNLANEMQVEQNTVSTTYQAFNYTVNQNNIPLLSIAQIPDGLITTQKTNFFVVGKNLYDKTKATDGYLVDGAHGGGFLTWATHSMSDWIPVTVGLSYILNTNCNYGFYDINKVFISGNNSVTSGTALIAPTNAVYIRFSIDITNGQSVKNTCQLEQNTVTTSYLAYGYVLASQYINIPSSPSWYNGKKLTTFGDSITAGATWQPYLMSKLGFSSYTNLGVGGTKLADDGSNTGMVTDARINTIPLDSDVILLMGGTNDWGSIPLGDLTYPYDVTRFKGALAQTILKLQTRCPNALIVVMSLLSGRGDVNGSGQAINGTTPAVNSLGLTSEDYANATKDVCHYMSTPFIDVFGKTGINQFNRATYITDTVHPNSAGGKLMANVIVNGLKGMEPVS
jgi:lysophospholipase L1-like esterase